MELKDSPRRQRLQTSSCWEGDKPHVRVVTDLERVFVGEGVALTH
jgi:hypothetical protein